MSARLPAVLALAFLLAGCAGGGGGASSSPSAFSSSSASTAPAPAPLPTSDTLHFLAAPDMAPALPAGGSEAATPVTVGNFGQGGQADTGAEWHHTLERAGRVTAGEVHVWVQIKNTLLQPPDTQASPSCSWSLAVTLGAGTPIQSCVQEPPGPIGAGTKELAFTLSLPSPVELAAGQSVTVHLARAGFSLSPSNDVDALSGSAEHDSRIRLAGLAEPIRSA